VVADANGKWHPASFNYLHKNKNKDTATACYIAYPIAKLPSNSNQQPTTNNQQPAAAAAAAEENNNRQQEK
jgi:hypothetical protein